MKKIRSKLSYSNVMVSILAIVVLGGGTAYAMEALPPNSVGTEQLKGNAVTGAKIANSTINSAKLAPNSVTEAAIAKGAVATNKLPTGAVINSKIAAGAVGLANLSTEAKETLAGSPSIVYAGSHDGVVELGPATAASPLIVATLSGLPPGSYAIQAKLNADSESETFDFTGCNLEAEGDQDEAGAYLGAASEFRMPFPMQIVHTFSGPGQVTVECYHQRPSDSASVFNIKLTAIKVGEIAVDGEI